MSPKLAKGRRAFVRLLTLCLLGISCAMLALRLASLTANNRQRVSNIQPVALRAVVMTGGTRDASLSRLIFSLCALVNDGDRVDVDVWIDVPKDARATGAIHARQQLAKEIEEFGHNGTYSNGRIRAHVWDRHVGLRGQWLDAWHLSIPGGLTEDTAEVGLMLEDDLELSPFAWRWLKAANVAYGQEQRVAGFTLQRAELCAARCPDLKGGPDGAGGGFLYPIVGSWGFAPRAKSFTRFRQWYYALPPDFKPYVDGISPTDWYMTHEKKGYSDRMWSMHYIYYTHTHEDKYTVYVKCKGDTALAMNHLEVGLNYNTKDEPTITALSVWDPDLLSFPRDPLALNYSGAVVSGTGLWGGPIL